MKHLKTPMDILKVLDRSNCRECGEPTCLAFAAAVFKGKRSLDECPRLDPQLLEEYAADATIGRNNEEDMEDAAAGLRNRVSAVDLASAAVRLGGRFSGDRLTIKVCGKDVHVDTRGKVTSGIHVHPWLVIPLLTYVLEGEGRPVSGNWVPFRELRGGGPWQGLFEQRCEKPLKKVADLYTDLFEDMLHVFNGKRVDNLFDSDISIVLYPLPRVPILFCYWKPEDGMESSLNMFFDVTAEKNLTIDGTYALITGLVRMFEKVAQRHGVPSWASKRQN
ncbi:MAG: DUF3786 domain-containing protein [Thermodesulfobacteriota bacterium]